MNDDDLNSLKQESNVEVTTPTEASRFEAEEFVNQLKLPDAVLRALKEGNHTSISPLQQSIWPTAMGGQDILIRAEMGIEQVGAFAVPIAARMANRVADSRSPLAFILVPTRELAYQVADFLRRLVKYQGTRILHLYGGTSFAAQAAALRSGIDVVIATPGRLADHLRRGTVSLSAVEILVLNGADEMLAMGFWQEVVDMANQMPKERQTILLSSVLAHDILKAAAVLLKEPVRLPVVAESPSLAHVHHHYVLDAGNKPKEQQICYVLEKLRPASVVVFCPTRERAVELAAYLTQQGFPMEALAKPLRPKERAETIERIQKRDLCWVTATDMGVRGIDLTGFEYVLSEQLPEFYEAYFYRANSIIAAEPAEHHVVSWVDASLQDTLKAIEVSSGAAFQEMVVPEEAEALQLKSLRMIEQLAEKANGVDLAADKAIADGILGHAQSSQIVAYLLQQYHLKVSAPKAPSDERGVESAQPVPAAGLRRRFVRHYEGGGRLQAAPRAQDRASTHYPAALPGPARRRRRVLTGGSHGMPTNGRHGHGEYGARYFPGGPSGRRSDGGGGRRQHYPRREAGGFEVVDAADLLANAAAPRGQRFMEEQPRVERSSLSVSHTGNQASFRVNIGFDDGFKGKGQVAKKIASLAGLNEGIIQEVEHRRDHAVLSAAAEVVDLILDRVDGASLGKKVIKVEAT
jgi:hypothetical protein